MDINISNAIARQFGFDSYAKILELCRDESLDLSTDIDGFQKLFNGYYRIRRNEEWRKEYYNYFERVKNNIDIDFNTIIDELYQRTNGNVEASFASKMLATICPNMPILDSQVLANLDLEIKGYKEKKLENAKAVYQQICQRYKEYQMTANCKNAIQTFDGLFPNYTDLTVTKKIDFFLWALKPNELRNIEMFKELMK